MQQQSGEYLALNPMLSCFGMNFALKFGGEDQKHKKSFFLQNLLVLGTRSLDLSCCFIEKRLKKEKIMSINKYVDNHNTTGIA